MKIISFVCTGNICRSVLGHYLFKQKYPEFEVRSYGMGRTAGGKKSPKFILKALENRNIVVNHISTKINNSIKESNLIITFVDKHTKILKEQGLNAKNIKEFATYNPFKGVSIPDPYFKPELTETICKVIESSLENIKLTL